MGPVTYIHVATLLGMLLSLSACGTSPTSGPTDAEPPTMVATPVPSSTETSSPAQSPSPTSTHTPTWTPRPTSTNTPLPPLPDFPDVLTFGGAGGSQLCWEYPSLPDSISVISAVSGEYVWLCVFLQSVNPDVPIRATFTELGGEGLELHSSDLVYVSSRKDIYWQFQEGERIIRWPGYSAVQSDDGSLKFPLFVSWPGTLPGGAWRVTVMQVGGSSATQDFEVARPSGRSYIQVTSPRAGQELVPGDRPYRTLLLSFNDRLNFVGVDYPPNAPVYMLLYKDTAVGGGMHSLGLVEKSLSISDESGTVRGALSGSYDEGTYFLYGITDAAMLSPEGNSGSCRGTAAKVVGSACDMFTVMPTSCAGAPPQRMALGMRGRVCTASGTVLLREEPSRSANILAQLSSGTELEVISGAACADNWSWWYVELDDGARGWVAEGGDQTDPYFICPSP